METDTPSHSITQPDPARACLGRRSGLPLLVCREKCGLPGGLAIRLVQQFDDVHHSLAAAEHFGAGAQL